MMQFAILTLFVWILILSAVCLKQHNSLRRFYKNTGKHELKGGIDILLAKDEAHEKSIKQILTSLEEINKASRFYFCKIGLVRYNPFGRIAGDQSFVIAMLDKESNGLLLNFIYNREGIRVYSKRVLKGKGRESDLSGEEVEAIAQAS